MKVRGKSISKRHRVKSTLNALISLLVLGMCFGPGITYADVSLEGNCYLENALDHSGIFITVSLTAATPTISWGLVILLLVLSALIIKLRPRLSVSVIFMVLLLTLFTFVSWGTASRTFTTSTDSTGYFQLNLPNQAGEYHIEYEREYYSSDWQDFTISPEDIGYVLPEKTLLANEPFIETFSVDEPVIFASAVSLSFSIIGVPESSWYLESSLGNSFSTSSGMGNGLKIVDYQPYTTHGDEVLTLTVSGPGGTVSETTSFTIDPQMTCNSEVAKGQRSLTIVTGSCESFFIQVTSNGEPVDGIRVTASFDLDSIEASNASGCAQIITNTTVLTTLGYAQFTVCNNTCPGGSDILWLKIYCGGTPNIHPIRINYD